MNNVQHESSRRPSEPPPSQRQPTRRKKRDKADDFAARVHAQLGVTTDEEAFAKMSANLHEWDERRASERRAKTAHRDRSRTKVAGVLGASQDFPHYRLRNATVGDILARVLAPHHPAGDVVVGGIEHLADDLNVLFEYVGLETAGGGTTLDGEIIRNHLAGIEARARALAEIARRSLEQPDETDSAAATDE